MKKEEAGFRINRKKMDTGVNHALETLAFVDWLDSPGTTLGVEKALSLDSPVHISPALLVNNYPTAACHLCREIRT